MPELPELTFWETIISECKGAPSTVTQDTEFALRIHPTSFFYDSSKQRYNLTVDRTLLDSYALDTHASQDDINLSSSSLKASEEKDWAYLLLPAAPGKLFCRRRGKRLVMMAGQHALVIHFTMEGCVIGMPRTDYDEITNSHVKTRGNKNDAWHRSFEIPRRLFEPNSSPTEFRTLNIYAAFVSKDWVWALTDHQRLMHIRVVSRENVWTQADLSPDSPSWDGQLFKGLNSPYDWIHERAEVEKALDRWRDSCRRSCGGPRTWGSTIIKSLADNNHRQSGSFGRHCINDTCYIGAVYPGTPESFIATNRETYTRLKTAMGAFADLIAHDDYKKKCLHHIQLDEPFCFQP
ncbi:hypothetical protein HGRIS_011925 [Hohenbuehelia grisea]|uniref:Uncharacterized protein n=1 Tax=Hohenbuehelia grisea TaxID=104357 RepID=A0ABR3JYT0_9AGAR